MASSVFVNIIGSSRGLKRAFTDAELQTKKFGKAMGTTRLAAIGLGGAAGTGLAISLRKGWDEFARGQDVGSRTNAVIKSTQGIAGVTAKHVDALALAMQGKSGIDDEAIQSGENVLLGFRNIRNEAGKGPKVFDRTTRAMLDLSVATGKSMPAAANILGKALDNPAKGFKRLTRLGFEFSDAEVAAITAMTKTGDTAGAQDIILSKLEERYKGTAEAAGKRLPGQLARGQRAFEEFAGSITDKVAPSLSEALGPALAVLPTVLSGAVTAVGGVMQILITTVTLPFKTIAALIRGDWGAAWDALRAPAEAAIGLLKGIIGPLLPYVTGIWDGIKAVTDTVWGSITGTVGAAISGVVSTVTGAAGRVSSAATSIGSGIVNGVKGGVAGLVSWMAGLVSALVSAVSGAISGALGAATRFGAGVLAGVKAGVADLVAWLTGRIRETVAAVTGAIGTATGAAARLGGGILGGVKSGVADLVGWLAGRIGEAVGAVRAAVGQATGAALAVGQGILKGVSDGLTGLVLMVQGWFQTLWRWIKGAAQSAYAFALNIGKQLIQGVIDGITGMVGKAIDAAKGAVSSVKSGFGLWGSGPADYGKWLGTQLMGALTKALTDGAKGAADAARSTVSSIKGEAVKGLNDVGQAIVAAAKKYGVDAKAALAVAMGEGGVKWGAVGDQGTSFGPFQLHIGGASPYGDPKKAAAFANSIEGVNYALRKMKEAGASGLTGAAAINAIVRLFERPADPDSSVRNAIARYASIPAAIGAAVGKASGAVEAAGPAMAEATKRQIAGIEAVVKAVAPKIGLEKARAIVRGFLQESPSMAQQIKEALRQAAAQAMQAATEKVREARGALGSAFSELASAALAAFDSQVAKWQSPARKILEKMRLEETARQIAEAVTKAQAGLGEAQTGLGEAQASGDPEKIKAAGQAVLAAQEELRRAERAAQEFHLEQTAQRQEAAHTKLMERRRVQFQNRLGALQAELAQEQAVLAKAQASGDPAAIAAAQKNITETQGKIRATFKSFIPEYELSGQAIGYAIAQGLTRALAAVIKAADAVALMLKKRLKLRSNAEEGELADVETWWSGLGPALVASASGSLSAIRGLGGSIASELRGGLESALPSSVGAFGAAFSGLEEALRPALVSLGLAKEPVENFAAAAQKTAEQVGSATTKTSAFVPSLTELGNTIGILEPTLRNKLILPMQMLKGAADAARDMIDGVREALQNLNGTRAETFTTHFVKYVVTTVNAPGPGPSGPGPTGPGAGLGTPPGTGPGPTYGRPYDRGGWLMPGLTAAVNNTGKPELVSPIASLKDALGAMVAPLATPALATAGRGIGGAGGLTINVNVTAEGSILAQHDLERKVHDAVVKAAKQGPLLSRTAGASL